MALGAVGWRRSGESRWTPFEIRADGPARGRYRSWRRATRRTSASSWAWSARHRRRARWPGRSRASKWAARGLDAEALPDYLLALRALLDAGGEAGLASLGLRVAALCAEEGERRVLQRRVEDALSLERYVMGGGRGEELGDWIGSQRRASWWPSSSATFALLRDILCGYLDPELKAVADEILLERNTESVEIEARDLRKERETDELEPVAPKPRPRRITAELRSHPEGVTESADWGPLDEDPESCSASRIVRRRALRRLGDSDIEVTEVSLGSWLTYGAGVEPATRPRPAPRRRSTPASTSSTPRTSTAGGPPRAPGARSCRVSTATRTCSRPRSSSR